MSPPADREECEEHGHAAAYVLSALEHDEAERYREHLEACSVCSAEVATLRPVVDSLPAGAPHALASQELRERLMATVRSEAELLHAAGAGADRPAPPRSRRRWRRPQLLAAAVTMGVGLLIGALVLSGGSSPTRVTAAQLVSAAPGATALLRQVGARAELVVSGVSQPPRGKIYEIWLAREGATPAPTDALFGVDSHGSASVEVPGNLDGVHQVMVTAEPVGGSAHPTSPPILVATLRSS